MKKRDNLPGYLLKNYLKKIDLLLTFWQYYYAKQIFNMFIFLKSYFIPRSTEIVPIKYPQQVLQITQIMDPNQVYDAINLGRRIDVIWPDEKMRQQGGRTGWQHWIPERGMEGCVVHRWLPNHRDPNRRSHVDKVILLVKVDDKYVPIAEPGVRDLGAEV